MGNDVISKAPFPHWLFGTTEVMENSPVIIAGAGIGGLALALTLHQIGVSCRVVEPVAELKPLGVGVNLQPNAVRELMGLDISTAELDAIGIQTKEWALVGLNGKDIYSEPRGLHAGYNWPQYSVHRGELQMLLLRLFLERIGPESLLLGHKVTGFAQRDETVVVDLENKEGHQSELMGTLLVGADGLHSQVRASLYPDQPPVQWRGHVMWRGVTQAKPIRTGASFVGLGTHAHRLVFYPISAADEDTGLATINWIAEIVVDQSQDWGSGDWNKRVDVESFIHHFVDWDYDWLDVPELLKGAESVYEYPMVDRDPLPSWVDGRVALLGDAAHVMYPTGSNGASQAIVDARELGAALIQHGVGPSALEAYDNKLCNDVAEVVLRNRGSGPFGILSEIEQRCGGVFDDVHAVISKDEIDEFMAGYKRAAGFAMQSLNEASHTITPGSKVSK